MKGVSVSSALLFLGQKSGFFLFVFCSSLFVMCTGQADPSQMAPMAIKEQEALDSTIQEFVGSWWNGSNLYPDPCGWTPIQLGLYLYYTTFYQRNEKVFMQKENCVVPVFSITLLLLVQVISELSF